ncbi:MAG: NUDIX hydrolase, partial [Gammaproteobacteria bacterium]|nr:NUDIX hydrolase [Gammaproteobacteria bacterium]
MPREPKVTVAAVIELSGRFLMVEERVNRRLLFNQPAGHVERG